ncbi:hypothetical protein [Thiohalorhabdus sp.]|uniref:hypothetical protein n=1 Tax=Thiohalorhabdus sp. TaxID=3094134 RepID=UPI002FC2992A
MPRYWLPVTPRKLPFPGHSNRVARAGAEFSDLEWNALINRARSLLRALEACRAGGEGFSCKVCPMAGTGSEGLPEARAAACRTHFRALERRLTHLTNQVPEPERQQLRRTVDGLHLAYRQLDPQEEHHGRDL